jgi:NADH-quinone oxidoreductase subunit L
VIHAAHHEQEMPQYGGLWRKIPITAATFAVAVLAIAGMPYLAGSYSKTIILTHAAAHGHSAGSVAWGYWLLFIIPAAVAYITPFYMTRCWMLTFAGKPRNQHLHDHAHEAPLLWVPLVVLAGMTLVAGSLLGVKELLQGAMVEGQNLVTATVGREAPRLYASAWPAPAGHHAESADDAAAAESGSGDAEPHGSSAGHDPAGSAAAELVDGKAHESEKAAVGWAWIIGVAAGVLVYARGYAVTDRLMAIAPLRWIRTWLYRRMYFDELYRAIIVGVTLGLSRLAAGFDRHVVDGVVNLVGWAVKKVAFAAGENDRVVVDGGVDGIGRLAESIGGAVRNPASGRVRLYVTALAVAVAIGIAGAVALAWS